ncbi:carbohydrate-binding protein [Martelella alba]|uniref:Carbohydrate-binding protein n=1 Tax=Martelella alba TaxID=2590451 RepID=A0A506UBD6_9HYPH|nr:carbohydrate-binding protein [Martelella alba]TPW31683.1 carbohydrate-binding protein [Martelella alba]
MTITIAIEDKDGARLRERTGSDNVYLVHESSYHPGEQIVIETDQFPCFLRLAVDAALAPSIIFMKEPRFSFPVPFDEQTMIYPPLAFSGTRHRIMARLARPPETEAPRNLAINILDHADNRSTFPHATATVETRGEAAFAARNAIDGEIAADNHGFWPYTSWGINADPDAAITIHFGRPVRISEVTLYTRADFPHDAWWEQASLTLSDGWTTDLPLGKIDGPQRHAIEDRITDWIRIDRLIKADDPSPFPALTQIEAWGTEV